MAKRLSRQERYDTLIQATYRCVAQKGLDGTTVRDIADYAGVTFGLIRHYFASKDELIEATYATITAEMTRQARDAAAGSGPDPAQRLAAFVTASLSGPIVSAQYLAFWSNFVGKVLFDERMRALHKDGFLDYRKVLSDLVAQTLAQAGRPDDARSVRLAVIKVNAVIDGIWIEACLGVDSADTVVGADLVDAGIDAVSAVLGLRLEHRADAAPV